MTKSEFDKIPPETIGTMNIMKDETAIAKYGEKGKDGVIELFTRKATTTLITESGMKDTIKVVAYGGVQFRTNGNKAIPLYVVDGVVITKEDLDKVDPQSFESVNILKAEAAITKYGEKGKDGVIEITTKKYYFDGTGNKKSVVKVIWDSTAPPPSFHNSGLRSENGANPLIVIDGNVMGKDFEFNSVNNANIASIEVLKDKSAVELYGGKAENGVILITSKKTTSPVNTSNSEIIVTGYAISKPDKSFVVMEQMPVFPGGESAMETWITSNLKYPGKAVKNKIEGNVPVNFLVTGTGKIKDVKVLKPGNALLDKEAERVISSMPDWKPGMQGGKTVGVQMQVTVNFKLK
jgi:TonB family protein